MHAIDAYRPEDRDACETLLRGLPGWFDDGDVAHALRHVSVEETRVLRDGNGTVLGFLSLGLRPLLWTGEPEPYVEVVAVAAGHQGEGLGRVLMLSAETSAGPGSALWLEMLEEDASVPRYRARRAFYEGLGYEAAGTYPSEGWGSGSVARAYLKRL